jgi:hypothetical protein
LLRGGGGLSAASIAAVITVCGVIGMNTALYRHTLGGATRINWVPSPRLVDGPDVPPGTAVEPGAMNGVRREAVACQLPVESLMRTLPDSTAVWQCRGHHEHFWRWRLRGASGPYTERSDAQARQKPQKPTPPPPPEPRGLARLRRAIRTHAGVTISIIIAALSALFTGLSWLDQHNADAAVAYLAESHDASLVYV